MKRRPAGWLTDAHGLLGRNNCRNPSLWPGEPARSRCDRRATDRPMPDSRARTWRWNTQVNRTRVICSFTAAVLATMLGSAALMSPRAQAAATGCLPSDIIDLHNWKLTLPVNNAQEITLPALYTYQSPYFSHEGCTAAVFRTPIGGATTPNSSYSRTELREMTPNGTGLAAWSNTSGTHEMAWRVAVDSVPPAKPQVV